MSCCCPVHDYYEEKYVNGICPDCEEPTIDGEAFNGCAYSPEECETCGYRPCDGSC